MGIVEREDDDVTMEKLDKALGELFDKKVRRESYVSHSNERGRGVDVLSTKYERKRRAFCRRSRGQ